MEEKIIDLINKTELHPMEYSVRQASQDILALLRSAIGKKIEVEKNAKKVYEANYRKRIKKIDDVGRFGLSLDLSNNYRKTFARIEALDDVLKLFE